MRRSLGGRIRKQKLSSFQLQTLSVETEMKRGTILKDQIEISVGWKDSKTISRFNGEEGGSLTVAVTSTTVARQDCGKTE
jgi:hypothetical protein